MTDRFDWSASCMKGVSMCLAIPAKITEIKDDNIASVSMMGAERDVALDLVPTAQVGDYVLVHAGFGIEIVDPTYAEETLDLIAEMAELAGEPIYSDDADAVCSVGDAHHAGFTQNSPSEQA